MVKKTQHEQEGKYLNNSFRHTIYTGSVYVNKSFKNNSVKIELVHKLYVLTSPQIADSKELLPDPTPPQMPISLPFFTDRLRPFNWNTALKIIIFSAKCKVDHLSNI